MSENSATQAQVKQLPVSAILLAMLAGVVGGAIGLVLGIGLGALLAKAFHVSQMEGTAGYFAMSIALLVVAVAAPASIILTLYWHGVRKLFLLVGFFAAAIGIAGVAAAGFAVWYMAQPHILNTNGPTPLLQFEIKPPEGQSLDSLAGIEANLNTDRNVMPAYWNKEEGNSGVRAGYVEVYFRTSKRLFVVKSPGGEDRIFRLKLPANPMKAKYREWSDWHRPDFVAKGAEQPSHPGAGPQYQLRYKIEYQDR